MGWNYISIPKLQRYNRYNRWSLGMEKEFHPKLYWACDYLYILELKLKSVSKRGPRSNISLSFVTSSNKHLSAFSLLLWIIRIWKYFQNGSFIFQLNQLKLVLQQLTAFTV